MRQRGTEQLRNQSDEKNKGQIRGQIWTERWKRGWPWLFCGAPVVAFSAFSMDCRVQAVNVLTQRDTPYSKSFFTFTYIYALRSLLEEYKIMPSTSGKCTLVKAHTKIERNHLFLRLMNSRSLFLKAKQKKKKKNCLKLTFESIFYYVPCTLFRMFWVLYFS